LKVRLPVDTRSLLEDVEELETERERLVERYEKMMKDISERFDAAKREVDECHDQDTQEYHAEVEQCKYQV
jgi:DNA-binding ferritin-like protein